MTTGPRFSRPTSMPRRKEPVDPDVTTFRAARPGRHDVSAPSSGCDHVSAARFRRHDLPAARRRRDAVSSARRRHHPLRAARQQRAAAETQTPGSAVRRPNDSGTQRPPTSSGTRGAASNNEGPLVVGQAFGPRYHIIKRARRWRHGRGLSGVGRRTRRRSRGQSDSPGDRGRSGSRRRNRASLQARAAARTAGHASQHHPHSRSRRHRRHQVHHDAVHRGIGPRDDSQAGRQAPGSPRACALPAAPCPDWSPLTRRASFIAI